MWNNYAMAAQKPSGTIAVNVPQEMSHVIWHLLRHEGEVNGKREWEGGEGAFTRYMYHNFQTQKVGVYSSGGHIISTLQYMCITCKLFEQT